MGCRAVTGLQAYGRQSFALYSADYSHWWPLQSDPLFHHLEKDFESQVRKGGKLWLHDGLGASFSLVTDLLHNPESEAILL